MRGAKKYWPNVDPIGRRMRTGSAERPTYRTVVGVVGNVKHFGLDDDARRQIFRPYSQAAWPVMTIVAKTATAPEGFASAVRGALQKIDPDLPVGPAITMQQIEQQSTGSRRLARWRSRWRSSVCTVW